MDSLGEVAVELDDVVRPHTLTVLCTYQCTAACRQCCFESSPRVTGRLDLQVILDRITEAKKEFPTLRLVVFSGGEAFLLKDDLFAAVKHCTTLGLLTRIVSNGSWGKTQSTARRNADRLAQSGLSELNISTGRDHQEWVRVDSVINAARAAAEAGIFTLVTVELDEIDNRCLTQLLDDPRIRPLMASKKLTVQSNSWMPFHEDAEKRDQNVNMEELRGGCSQIFGNIVVTPHDNLSACCGLTLEHIPEMRLGRNQGDNMGELYRSQTRDFLKFWLKVDGPYTIIERVMEEDASTLLDGVVHICQACAILHKNPAVRARLNERYTRFVPEVMSRFGLANALESRISRV